MKIMKSKVKRRNNRREKGCKEGSLDGRNELKKENKN